MEREVLISSPWHPGTGRMGMVQSCAMGGLDWTLGSISFSHLDNGADGSLRAALEGAGTRCSFLRSL